MPIYEYRCEDCGHELEKIQKMNDPALTDCPNCKKPALKKLISAAGFRLSGTGWYATDFKGKSTKDTKKKDGDDAPATPTPTKTDTPTGGTGSGSGSGSTGE